MKLFSTQVHGVLDYVTVATLPLAARLLKADAGQTLLMDHATLAVLGYSLLTRYELGAVKVLPMPGHLICDAAVGTVLCVASEDAKDNPALRTAMIGLGLFSLFASVATETNPRRD